LRSLVDNVIPLDERCTWSAHALKWPLFIAFLTRLVNDENDEVDWIGFCCVLLVFELTLESIEDIASDFGTEIVFDDDELANIDCFGWFDETISANGVHRLFVVVVDDKVGASELSENIGSEQPRWLARCTR